MTGDGGDGPDAASNPAELLSQAMAPGPRADLTYRTLEGLALNSCSLKQSLLTGAILRQVVFTAVDLSRCDLDGMRIEASKFVDCDFTNVDMRSTTIARSLFENCTFASAYLVDDIFVETTFLRCRFPSAVVSECSFERSCLVSLELAESSFTHNRFNKSEIADTALGNCTFLYTRMIGCKLKGSTSINAESIGMTYGLTKSDLASLGLIYLGAAQLAPSDDALVPALVEAYAQRRWQIGICVLRLNFGLTSAAYALNGYLSALRAEAATEQPLQRDQLTFFAAVLDELGSTNQLPLVSCLDAVDTFEQLAVAREARGDESAHATGALRTLGARLFSLLQTLLHNLEQGAPELSGSPSDQSVIAKFTFRTRPAIPTAQLLNEVGAACGLPILHETRLLEVRSGSYIEIVRTTLFTLAALRFGIYLLKGCLIEVTETRARLQVLFRKTLPQPYRQAALSPRQELPPYLVASLQRLAGWATGFVAEGDPNLKNATPPNLLTVEASTDAEVIRPEPGA